jgi:hypothetical protein
MAMSCASKTRNAPALLEQFGQQVQGLVLGPVGQRRRIEGDLLDRTHVGGIGGDELHVGADVRRRPRPFGRPVQAVSPPPSGYLMRRASHPRR